MKNILGSASNRQLIAIYGRSDARQSLNDFIAPCRGGKLLTAREFRAFQKRVAARKKATYVPVEGEGESMRALMAEMRAEQVEIFALLGHTDSTAS
ncbi:MAG: hypothetical protein ACYDEV_04370 [Acidiferrobacter sp.]